MLGSPTFDTSLNVSLSVVIKIDWHSKLGNGLCGIQFFVRFLDLLPVQKKDRHHFSRHSFVFYHCPPKGKQTVPLRSFTCLVAPATSSCVFLSTCDPMWPQCDCEKYKMPYYFLWIITNSVRLLEPSWLGYTTVLSFKCSDWFVLSTDCLPCHLVRVPSVLSCMSLTVDVFVFVLVQ